MTLKPNKWYYICFGIILMGIINWKHFFDFLHWSLEVSSSFFTRFRKRYPEEVYVWRIEPNCGIRHSCPGNSFPIFLSTAFIIDNQPRLCVAGKYVIKPKEKGEGRGLNGAIVDSNTFKVKSVRNFDTYMYNKTVEIAEWLDKISENDILIIFVSDEASKKLDSSTKTLLNQLGSGKIQNLHFRSQWFMITQKGVPGFTTYEKMTFSKKKSWGDAIEFRGCVPRKIPKKMTTPDEPLKHNRKKVQFCEGKSEEKYKGFCNEPRFEIIMPALATNKSLLENLVYSVPIFLYASEDIELVISSLDNMIHQPGVVASLITVLHNSNSSEIPSLAKIYGTRSHRTKFAGTFKKRLKKAGEISKKYYPQKKYLIVLDLGVIPSPDFLYFMAQILPILEKDSTASAISGWNCNCYKHNGDLHLVYRVNGHPKYGALISTAFDTQGFHGEMLAPDVARVQGTEACHLPSLEPNIWITRPQDLLKNRYFNKLVMLQQLGHVVEEEDILNSCSDSAVKNETNVIYVQSRNKSLSLILKCLGILRNQYSEYNGIIRLYVNRKSVLIITNESSFYKSRPIVSTLELAADDVKTSTQIGLSYSPARTIMYEKKALKQLPKVKIDGHYKVGTVYTPNEGLKSTYNETYKIPIKSINFDAPTSKLIKQQRDLSKSIKQSKQLSSSITEYIEQYPVKPLPTITQGTNVEKLANYPMVLTGRDEREPLPLTENIYKHLDIYLSTSRLAHRAFTAEEQKMIAAKNIVTTHETMDIPKGRGFGCKFQEFVGQDLEKREKNVIDKKLFKSEHKLRLMPKRMPKVPNFGSESETQAAYKRPEGVAVRHLFDRFIEFPEIINAPTARQSLCPPGMYTTESYAINHHTSPQTVL